MHTRTHARTHTHTHAHTHALTHTLACTHTQTHTASIHSYTHTHAHIHPHTVYSHDNPAVHFSSPYRQLQWLHLCFVNSWLMLSPFHLSCDWRMGGVPTVTSLASPWNIATVSTLGAIATLGMYSLRGKELHQKHVLFSLFLIIFPYLPASNLFFPVGFVVAERILYIPSMGICLLTAFGIWHVVQQAERKVAKWAVLIGLGYLLVAYTVKTVQRNRDWYSDRRLYESAVHIFPENALMMNNLAVQYNETGNMTSEMEVLLATACRLAPNVTLPHVSLGRLLRDQERFSEAEKVYTIIDKWVNNLCELCW